MSTVLPLVGGPFDGDTMKFQPEQTEIKVPDSAGFGPIHVYSVAANGTARYVRTEHAVRGRHAEWCPRRDKGANMSGGYCTTCGERVSSDDA